MQISITSSKKSFLGYLLQVLADRKRLIITSVGFSPGNKDQKYTIIDAMKYYYEKVAPKLPHNPGKFALIDILADSAFDYWWVYESARKYGMNPYISLRKKPSIKNMFDTDKFTMINDSQLKCPAGHTMKRSENPDREGVYTYYGGKNCDACPLKGKCTTGKKGRTVQLNPEYKTYRQLLLKLA